MTATSDPLTNRRSPRDFSPSPALLKQRSRVLWELLRHYEDLVDPQQSRGSFGEDLEHGVGLMPMSYTPSLKELERLLKELQMADRSLWWQLHARFFLQIRVRRVVRRKVSARKGKKWVAVQVSVERWDSRVDCCRTEKPCGRCRCCEGVAWLAARWRARFEPMLPEGLTLPG